MVGGEILDNTLIGWMFAHPWMAFFILITFAASFNFDIGRKIIYKTTKKNKE